MPYDNELPPPEPWHPTDRDDPDAHYVANAVRMVATVAGLGALVFLSLIWIGSLWGWIG